MLKIRRPLGRLIFNMGIAIPGKTVFLIETAPCCFVHNATLETWNRALSGNKNCLFWRFFFKFIWIILYWINGHLLGRSNLKVIVSWKCIEAFDILLLWNMFIYFCMERWLMTLVVSHKTPCCRLLIFCVNHLEYRFFRHWMEKELIFKVISTKYIGYITHIGLSELGHHWFR